METKLTTITPTYRSFVPDQVLTADQLNEFLNYFEDQDRLSRIFLSGVGIVCGFNLNFDQRVNGKLFISQGAGVTTDGDFFKLSAEDSSNPALRNINIPELGFTHYRAFDDSKAKYKPFFWKNVGGSDVQLNLWEAIPADKALPSDQTIISRTDLQNLVVLLYLEDYEEDPTACTGIDCENQGIKNIRQMRVLLVSEADAQYIFTNDSIFNANSLISTYLNLDEVSVQRVTVNATNSANFATLRSNYLSAIQAENTISKLINGYNTMLNKLGMTSEAAYISSKLTQFFGSGANYPQMYFQYRYDFLLDIVNSYNELKDMFMDSICGCNPDIKSFPKHLGLGKLIPAKDDQHLKRYRHGFYKSPILKDEKNWCERFKLYVARTLEMLGNYTIDIPMGEIRITPSSYRSLTENKAIPFYYGDRNFNRLLETWNFDKYKVNKQTRNLSYHTQYLDTSGPIQFPLKYNLEPHNFLRVEGLHGYAYQSAMQKINDLKNQYGLAFDVKALGITINTGDTINMQDYACHFEDLQVMLDAWTQEHECLLGKVSKYYSAFSTASLGTNFLMESYLYPVASTNTGLAPGSTSNVVKDKMYTGDNALGTIMIPVFDQFKGCSGNDILVQVNRLIDRFDYNVELKDIAEATLKGPNEVLSHAYVMMDKRPLTLANIIPSVVESVNASATNLCGAARKTFSKAAAITSKLPKDTLTMLYNLSQDSTAICCSAEKLKVIYDEIERRKQEILLGLSLAKFQEQHPGMEHLAGLHPGDTFILVYVRNAVNGIAANTVVADFTLPYLCCSDCRPVGFIMPAVAADLRLASSSICVEEGSVNTIDIYRYPVDGTVQASPAVLGVSVEGDQLVIEAGKLPESIYGQEIHFTINGHETNAILTLNKATQASIIVPSNPITSATVPFDCSIPSGTDPQSYTYFWDFGDGTTSTEKAPTHTYATPIPNGSTVTVSLTVTGGYGTICPVSMSNILQFSISPGPSVCDQEATAYFNALKAQFTAIKDEAGLTQPVINDIDVFYQGVSKKLSQYLTGNLNSVIGSNLNTMSKDLFDVIYSAYSAGDSTEALVKIYHNTMRFGLTIVRCQPETLFMDGNITNMIKVYIGGIDPSRTPSLWSMGIPSNTTENIDFLNTVMSLRDETSASWHLVNDLLTVVAYNQ